MTIINFQGEKKLKRTLRDSVCLSLKQHSANFRSFKFHD